MWGEGEHHEHIIGPDGKYVKNESTYYPTNEVDIQGNHLGERGLEGGPEMHSLGLLEHKIVPLARNDQSRLLGSEDGGWLAMDCQLVCKGKGGKSPDTAHSSKHHIWNNPSHSSNHYTSSPKIGRETQPSKNYYRLDDVTILPMAPEETIIPHFRSRDQHERHSNDSTRNGFIVAGVVVVLVSNPPLYYY
jgi:hypothetical protein